MKKAAIIGGSMSGLFAANFLKKINWDYSIHEMVPEPLSGRGAGIATYDELAELVRLTTGYKKSLGTTCDERIVLNKQNSVVTKMKYPQVFTSWQYLYDVLLSNIDKKKYFLGDECIQILKKDNINTLIFKSGKEIQADLIIIANGIRSNIKKIVDENEPEFAGYVGWRGLVNETDLSKDTFNLISDYFCFVLPQNQQFLTYPVAGVGNKGLEKGKRRINWLWYKPVSMNEYNSILTGKSNTKYKHGIPPNEIRDQFIDNLKEEGQIKLPTSINELINKTEQILVQPIYDLKCKKMVNENIVIIGDCAFTARPHAGMGVTKAGFDCYDLMKSLENIKLENLNNALKSWEQKRIKEGMFLVKRSREMGFYIKKDESIIMPQDEIVLNETAVSIKNINDYPNKSNLFN